MVSTYMAQKTVFVLGPIRMRMEGSPQKEKGDQKDKDQDEWLTHGPLPG